MAFLIVFLIIFIFFKSLGLRLIYISTNKILDGLIFVFILIIPMISISFVLIFFGWFIVFWILRVNFSYF